MESIPRRQVIVVSYYSGLDGYVSSEWADDKGLGLKMAGFETHLLCSTSGRPNPLNWNTVHQAASISWIDFQREDHSASRRKSFGYFFSWSLAFSVGRLLDVLERVILRQHSDGRLSWAIAAWPKLLVLALRYPKADFLFLGGPSGAHLLSIICGGLLRRNCVSELQDPLFASHLKIGGIAKWSLLALERLLIISNKKIVFTSRKALEEFKSRNYLFQHKAQLIYPGAPSQANQKKADRPLPFDITLVHLGTLYGSRNLDSLIAAIRHKNLVEEKSKIGILNVGFVEQVLRTRYAQFEEIVLWDSMQRSDALAVASSASLLLLIQHYDQRSNVTIPFKFYDYLNLDVPILAITNSDELSELCETFGVTWCSVGTPIDRLSDSLSAILTASQKKVSKKINFLDSISRLIEI